LIVGKAVLLAAMQLEPHVFPSKAVIPKEGDWENKVCEIVSGSAVRRCHNQTVSDLLPGDLFGVSELFSGRPSLDSIETREMVSVRSISYASVLDLAARDANVALWLLCHVSQHSSQNTNDLTLLARGNALKKEATPTDGSP
jgi:CRP-like cAMP-binding protein